MRKRRRIKEDVGISSLPESNREAPAECLFDSEGPHRLEQSVQRVLLGHPRLRFSSLVVRRIRDGICLEGVLEADKNLPDVTSLAQRVAGVDKVLNHLVIRRRPPKKG